MRKFQKGFFVAVLFTLSACSSHRAPEFLVIGHQGAPAREPSNSMRSFRSAAEAGARGLWTQVVQTKDQQWVVAMDSELKDMGCLPAISSEQRFGQGSELMPSPNKKRDTFPADPSIRPSTGTLSELMFFDCKSFQRDEFPQQAIRLHSPIVTVRELFAYVRGFNTNGPHLKIFLELSKEDFNDSESLQEEVLEADFSEGTVFFIEKGQAKGMSKIQSIAGAPKSAPKSAPASYAVLSLESADPAHIKSHNSKKERVIVEVVNTPEDWQRLLDWGVYGIVTDDPHRLVEYWRNKHSTKNQNAVHHTPMF